MASYHLAQINIARMVAAQEDPVMEGFFSQLDAMNALAERSPGFVWRLVGDGGDATDVRVYEDERILVNMSVWESMEALHDYTYRSAHAGVFKDRKQWFEMPKTAHMALWWVPAGYRPTAAEGRAKLEHLDAHGPTAEAFTFKQAFPKPD